MLASALVWTATFVATLQQGASANDCVRESAASSVAVAFRACDDADASLGEGSNWNANTVDEEFCTDTKPHIYGVCDPPTPNPTPAPQPPSSDFLGAAMGMVASMSLGGGSGGSGGGGGGGQSATSNECTDSQKTADTSTRKARYLTAQAAIHKMFIATARFNQENPSTYCNAASCSNPAACDVVLPPCRVLVGCKGHWSCTVNGTTLDPAWLVYNNCSRTALQSFVNIVAADSAGVATIPTGAENTAALVPSLDGHATDSSPDWYSHGERYWQRQSADLPCAVPAYDSDFRLTNAASQASDSNPMSCRPAKCIGGNNGPDLPYMSAFETVAPQLPNHACKADCRTKLNSCDPESGGVFTCSKYCIRLLEAKDLNMQMDGQGNCMTIDNLQPHNANIMQSKEFVWPALISKSIACSKVCHNSSNHPVECTASANLVPTMQCYTQKTAKLYNCAKRCPEYGDYCDFDTSDSRVAPTVTDCISKIGSCMRGADSAGLAYCEEIDANSYRVDTNNASCSAIKKFHGDFMTMAATE